MNFRDTLRVIDASPDAGLAWDVLAILAVASGPISTGDLATLLEQPGRRVRAAIEPIRMHIDNRAGGARATGALGLSEYPADPHRAGRSSRSGRENRIGRPSA